MDKRYLLYLQGQGHAVVPTHIATAQQVLTYTHAQACAALDHPLQTLVLKPVISASGENTHLWKPNQSAPLGALGSALTPRRLWMIQPLVESITTQGECSLLFFKGRLSHAVRKRPVTHPFLVHEEHGGVTEPYTPDAELLAVAHRLIQAPLWEVLLADALYARLDYVYYQGQWCLMEMELIEPALYLAYDAQAPARWAQRLAFDIYGYNRIIMEQL